MPPISCRATSPLLLGHARAGEAVNLGEEERARHVHVIGSPGTGKSKALEYWIRQDILAGRGVCLLDPHGYLYDDLVAWCAGRRFLGRRRIVLLDASSDAWSFGFNPLRFVTAAPEEIARAVDAMIKACAQVWGGEDTARTPLLRRCLRAVFQVLAEQGLTLAESVPLMSAEDTAGLRRFLTRDVRHPLFAAQWADFNSLRPRDFQELFASTNNRLVEFLHNPLVERIVGQRERVLDFGALMDEGAIVLVRLGGGALSLDAGSLLGALLVNDLVLRSFDRPKGSRPFRLYVDECHRFLNDDVSRILNEGRKFGLHLVLAHQNLGQLREAGEGVFRAVFGTARTKVVFGGLDPEDAELFGRSLFAGEFDYETPKRRFMKPTVVGHRRVLLRGESTSDSVSRSSSETITESEGWTEGTSYDPAGDDERESLSSRGQTSMARSESETVGKSRSRNSAETLAPILKSLPTQGYSLDELRDCAAARLMNLHDRAAVVKTPGQGSQEVEIPQLESPKATPDAIRRFVDAVMTRTAFIRSAVDADEELSARRRLLAERALAYAHPREPKRFRE